MKTVLTNTIFSLVCALVIFGFGEQLQLDRKLTRFACISTFLLEFTLCIAVDVKCRPRSSSHQEDKQ